MDLYAEYYKRASKAIPYGAQNWTADTLPHIERTVASVWAESRSSQSYRLVFFENVINDFLQHESHQPDRDTLMLCTEIVWGCMTEACGAATCDEYTAWLLGELSLSEEVGTFAILCAMSKYSRQRGCGHKSVIRIDASERIVLDAMYGETLVGRKKMHAVNSQIIYGDADNDAVDYSIDIDSIRSLPLCAPDSRKLHLNLRKYHDYFRSNYKEMLQKNSPRGADELDLEICINSFLHLLMGKINKKYTE